MRAKGPSLGGGNAKGTKQLSVNKPQVNWRAISKHGLRAGILFSNRAPKPSKHAILRGANFASRPSPAAGCA